MDMTYAVEMHCHTREHSPCSNVSAADLLKQLYRKGLPGQVKLFKARTDLSLGSYLVKLGLGDSKNLWLVLVEAEQAMSRAGLAG